MCKKLGQPIDRLILCVGKLEEWVNPMTDCKFSSIGEFEEWVKTVIHDPATNVPEQLETPPGQWVNVFA